MMTSMVIIVSNLKNVPPCADARQCPRCPYAFTCHDDTVSLVNSINWAPIGLGLLLVIGMVANLF